MTKMHRDHHLLWEVSNGDTTTMCVMVSCCGGAELQVVRAVHGDEEIILRELYPDRSPCTSARVSCRRVAAAATRAMLDSDA